MLTTIRILIHPLLFPFLFHFGLLRLLFGIVFFPDLLGLFIDDALQLFGAFLKHNEDFEQNTVAEQLLESGRVLSIRRILIFDHSALQILLGHRQRVVFHLFVELLQDLPYSCYVHGYKFAHKLVVITQSGQLFDHDCFQFLFVDITPLILIKYRITSILH